MNTPYRVGYLVGKSVFVGFYVLLVMAILLTLYFRVGSEEPFRYLMF